MILSVFTPCSPFFSNFLPVIRTSIVVEEINITALFNFVYIFVCLYIKFANSNLTVNTQLSYQCRLSGVTVECFYYYFL